MKTEPYSVERIIDARKRYVEEVADVAVAEMNEMLVKRSNSLGMKNYLFIVYYDLKDQIRDSCVSHGHVVQDNIIDEAIEIAVSRFSAEGMECKVIDGTLKYVELRTAK